MLVRPKRFADARGFFQENYRAVSYMENGITAAFVQTNWSRSHRHVLRGLHYQLQFPQAKLVSVLRGAILDVAVDLRASSPTFRQWTAHVLSDENGEQLYIPQGHAHGFVVLSDLADVSYQVDDIYHPEDDHGLIWSDPDLAVDWTCSAPFLSEKDTRLPRLADLSPDRLPA
jgi:dTDP-4-dehydrorhamnose 3,5-epimerase